MQRSSGRRHDDAGSDATLTVEKSALNVLSYSDGIDLVERLTSESKIVK